MKKLLASDIDGTLYVNEEVHEKSIEYIKAFRESGHTFLLCTGRNFGGVKHLIESYDIEPDGYVLCNGAVVLDKDLNVIHNQQVEYSLVKKVFEECKETTENDFYFVDKDHLYIVEGYNSHPMLSGAEANEKMGIVRISEEEFYKNEYNANMIGVYVKDKCIEKAKQKIIKLEELLGEDVSMYRNQYFIDIAPKNTSKSEGISRTLGNYEVEEDNVFVIGDSWNDLSMFEKYKNSYTFSYAEEELKPHASNVVDAFYDCLETLLD